MARKSAALQTNRKKAAAASSNIDHGPVATTSDASAGQAPESSTLPTTATTKRQMSPKLTGSTKAKKKPAASNMEHEPVATTSAASASQASESTLPTTTATTKRQMARKSTGSTKATKPATSNMEHGPVATTTSAAQPSSDATLSPPTSNIKRHTAGKVACSKTAVAKKPPAVLSTIDRDPVATTSRTALKGKKAGTKPLQKAVELPTFRRSPTKAPPDPPVPQNPPSQLVHPVVPKKVVAFRNILQVAKNAPPVSTKGLSKPAPAGPPPATTSTAFTKATQRSGAHAEREKASRPQVAREEVEGVRGEKSACPVRPRLARQEMERQFAEERRKIEAGMETIKIKVRRYRRRLSFIKLTSTDRRFRGNRCPCSLSTEPSAWAVLTFLSFFDLF
jgi:hypothetical protein